MTVIPAQRNDISRRASLVLNPNLAVFVVRSIPDRPNMRRSPWGPHKPIPIESGAVVERDGFVSTDILGRLSLCGETENDQCSQDCDSRADEIR